MRISVIAGVLTCTVIFAASSTQVEASTLTIKDSGVEVALLSQRILSEEIEVGEEAIAQLSNEDNNSDSKKNEIKKHVVAESETLSKIAEKHKTTWKRIFDKNTDIENPDIINPGEELIIPNENEDLVPRELPVVAPLQTQTAASRQTGSNEARSTRPATPQTQTRATVARGSSAGNGYVAGYCTWYVKNMRPDLPNNLGNAYSWYSRAAAQGMAVGSTPRTGAVGQRGNHVVYVQSVNSDGTVTISEMNHKGLYVKTTRTLPANYFRYIY